MPEALARTYARFVADVHNSWALPLTALVILIGAVALAGCSSDDSGRVNGQIPATATRPAATAVPQSVTGVSVAQAAEAQQATSTPQPASGGVQPQATATSTPQLASGGVQPQTTATSTSTPQLASGGVQPQTTATSTPSPDDRPDALTQISSGYNHACAIRNDRTLVCWGGNQYGQADPPEGEFTQVASGNGHSCAVDAGREVQCWGRNEYSAASPPTSTFLRISSYDDTYCGIKTNQVIGCWGEERYGRNPWPSGRFSDVVIGEYGGCAIHLDRTVECWGYNEYHSRREFRAISAGRSMACGIDEHGELRCWELDNDNAVLKLYGNFTDVSVGYDDHVCGIQDDGTLSCTLPATYHSAYGFGSQKFTAMSASANGKIVCAIHQSGDPLCWTWDSESVLPIWGLAPRQ